MNLTWTHAELLAMRRRLQLEVQATEAEFGANCRPLPPMTSEEARDLLIDLIGPAEQRPLTRDEVFMHGQAIAVFQQAVRAETLGYRGRFFVIPEEQVEALVEQQRKERSNGNPD